MKMRRVSLTTKTKNRPTAKSPPPSFRPFQPLLALIKAHKFLLGLALVILVADQASKAWIRANIPFNSYVGPHSIEIIPDYFYIVHVGNWGAAFGQFQGFGWLFVSLAFVFLGAIAVFRKFFELGRPFMQFTFGLIVGGIIGNLIDRIWQGFVTDFILNVIPIINYEWPVYNIADAGIVVGFFLYGYESIRNDFLEYRKKKAAEAEVNGAE